MAKGEKIFIGNDKDWILLMDSDAKIQKNSNDCGLFTLMFAYCRLKGHDYYDQEDMNELRRHIIKKIYEKIRDLANFD